MAEIRAELAAEAEKDRDIVGDDVRRTLRMDEWLAWLRLQAEREKQKKAEG